MSSDVINYFLGKKMFSLHVIQTDLNLLEACLELGVLVHACFC